MALPLSSWTDVRFRYVRRVYRDVAGGFFDGRFLRSVLVLPEARFLFSLASGCAAIAVVSRASGLAAPAGRRPLPRSCCGPGAAPRPPGGRARASGRAAPGRCRRRSSSGLAVVPVTGRGGLPPHRAGLQQRDGAQLRVGAQPRDAELGCETPRSPRSTSAPARSSGW